MKISTKGRYGVQIMVEAARSTGVVKIADIAARQGLAVKYAEQIAALLLRAKLLKSVRGAMGGYELVKPAQQYTMAEILSALEGDFEPVGCIADPATCERSADCGMMTFWKGLHDCVENYLEGVTLQDLVSSGAPGDFYQI